MKHNFGQLLAEGRKQANLKQSDLSNKTNMSLSYIGKIEAGTSVPSPRKMLSILENISLNNAMLNKVIYTYTEYLSISDANEMQYLFFESDVSNSYFIDLLTDSKLFISGSDDMVAIYHSNFISDKFLFYKLKVLVLDIIITLNVNLSFSDSKKGLCLLSQAADAFQHKFEFINFYDFSNDFFKIFEQYYSELMDYGANPKLLDEQPTFDEITDSEEGEVELNSANMDISLNESLSNAVDFDIIDDHAFISIINKYKNRFPDPLCNATIFEGTVYNRFGSYSMLVCYSPYSIATLSEINIKQTNPIIERFGDLVNCINDNADEDERSRIYQYLFDTFNFIEGQFSKNRKNG